MPGTLLHEGAIVMCAHGAPAKPIISNPLVKVSGQSIVVQSSIYTISGCPNQTTTVPPVPFPCVTAQWVKAATKIKAGGLPVLLKDSASVCVPTGTKLQIQQTQIKVKGQ